MRGISEWVLTLSLVRKPNWGQRIELTELKDQNMFIILFSGWWQKRSLNYVLPASIIWATSSSRSVNSTWLRLSLVLSKTYCSKSENYRENFCFTYVLLFIEFYNLIIRPKKNLSIWDVCKCIYLSITLCHFMGVKSIKWLILKIIKTVGKMMDKTASLFSFIKKFVHLPMMK